MSTTTTTEADMTGHLLHDAQLTRFEELRHRAKRRRPSASPTTEDPMQTAASISIRHSTPADADAVERLAALDSAAAPRGELLIASVDGEPQAALELATGAAIADPFRPTAQLVDLLRVRAATMRAQTAPARRLPRLRAALRIA
jgi:hypothetical protein